jgi:hypothetical protein
MRLKKFGGSALSVEWILAAGLLAVLGYLLMAESAGFKGFPLDDAWIHQTYARNLAELGEWSFLPGQISAGSTAPLWSALLAFGRLLGLDYWLWTITLGWLCLAGLGIAGAKLFGMLVGNASGRSIAWVGVFLVSEWHLVWAAVSGMETVLFCGLVLVLFYMLARVERAAAGQVAETWRYWLATGLMIGGLVWVRPDGMTMLGPAVLVCLAIKTGERQRQTKTKNLLALAAGFGILMIPYLVFNQAISGSWLPNTFYAKQAEYAVRLETPFIVRAFQLYKLPMIGAGVFLLPGVSWLVAVIIQRRWWSVGSAVLWWLGYTLIFVMRLPLDYQHGRYLMPTMPVYFILGLVGTIWLLKVLATTVYRKRMISFGAASALAGVTLVFYFAGAAAYLDDVGVIETEMVAAAKWAAVNLPSEALIAAHDIGALGYFGEHSLLDLAGLVSPDVIPFIGDEEELSKYLNQNGVDYLAIFPGWYPELSGKGVPVYQTNGAIAPKLGDENIVIYLWSLP